MTSKTPAEITAIRASGQMLAQVLGVLRQTIVPGMTGIELDALAVKELKSLGGKPAFLGYQGFPATLCVSVNDEVIHGIPNDKPFAEGDIVGLDYGVDYDGMITDSAITVPVGEVSADAARLLRTTKAAMERGIGKVAPGVPVGDVAHAIHEVLKAEKLGVVEDYGGHGVGHAVHEEPFVPNFGPSGVGPELVAGMTIAIEPMATLGRKVVRLARDGWTVYTKDGSLAAHFEHTVLVTETGHEIVTQLRDNV